MGLDVYLRKCANLDAAKAAEDAAESETSALWESAGKYDSLTDAQKEELRAKQKEINAKHGVVDYRHESIVELDEIASTIDPDHMFKIGYFRSSYNGGGIERVLRKLGLPTLHDIFSAGDDYRFAPDWDDALVKVNSSIAGYEAHLASPLGKFAVFELSPMYEFGAKSEADALQIFAKELERGSSFGDGGYSNRDGEFFPQGMKVHAVITKTFSSPTNAIDRLISRPTQFVVYEKDKPEDGKEDWYLTALKIVRESIEYVIAQPDKQHFYLVWSG